MSKSPKEVEAAASPLGRGRPKINFEQMPARFPEGTFERMDKLLKEGETRADLVRDAVDTALALREVDAERAAAATRKAAEAQAKKDAAKAKRAEQKAAREAEEKRLAAKAKRDEKKAKKAAAATAAAE